MNRSDGLTKRNVSKKPEGASAGGADDIDTKADWGDWDTVEDADLKEEDDHESKDMKLTLMEEVLLLGLKDREVIIIRISDDHHSVTYLSCLILN